MRSSIFITFLGACEDCIWPCCAKRSWVRGSGYFCLLLSCISLMCWIAMGYQLYCLMECVKDDNGAFCKKVKNVGAQCVFG